jgi:hypothetical protein
LKAFEGKDQEMIFRWAAESLGVAIASAAANPAPQLTISSVVTPGAGRNVPSQTDSEKSVGSVQDIKTFVATKSPKSDVQFAATVAYYHQFLAPVADRKSAITQDDLLDACRKADWQRPPNPYQTLNNAFHLGLLDRPEKGTFSINSVGENLVAMALPGEASVPNPKKRIAKKAARKPASKGPKSPAKSSLAKAKV